MNYASLWESRLLGRRRCYGWSVRDSEWNCQGFLVLALVRGESSRRGWLPFGEERVVDWLFEENSLKECFCSFLLKRQMVIIPLVSFQRQFWRNRCTVTANWRLLLEVMIGRWGCHRLSQRNPLRIVWITSRKRKRNCISGIYRQFWRRWSEKWELTLVRCWDPSQTRLTNTSGTAQTLHVPEQPHLSQTPTSRSTWAWVDCMAAPSSVWPVGRALTSARASFYRVTIQLNHLPAEKEWLTN